MLHITDLHATTVGKPILSGLSLGLNAGEVHSIIGLNGTGKAMPSQGER